MEVCAALESREELSSVIEYLKTLQLTPIPVHPGMGCPDMPGLWEETQPEQLHEEDLECIAHELMREHVEVNYIKGHVQSRDEVQSRPVEEIRQQILQDYASTVSVVGPQGTSLREGSLGRQRSS